MKIGIAIIACDRVEYTAQCIKAIENNLPEEYELLLINDGHKLHIDKNMYIETIGYSFADDNKHFIESDIPYSTVGVAKNSAMKFLTETRGCEHIFLVENDIIVKSPLVWEAYISAANTSGLTHLNFGYHGPANMSRDYKSPNPRCIIDYGNNLKIALNAHSVGAFSYFNKKYIDKVGYHDTHFKNAWEHVELCQRGVEAGLLPAFWWFPDIANSPDMLSEIPGSINNSSITHTDEWTDNMRKGASYYEKLHGFIPVRTPDTPQSTVVEKLKAIHAANT